MGPDRNQDHLFQCFREKIMLVLTDMQEYSAVHMPGVTWKLIEGFRTAAYQNSLYQKGRRIPPLGQGHIVTNCDGYKKRSNHQSSMASDIVPFRGSQVLWDAPLDHWAYLGHIARKHGLEWGGDWRMRDFPHIQWDQSDAEAYKAARKWQRSGNLA